jgi:hypothetical protein
MPTGSVVNILWGISFEESYKVQKGDKIKVNGDTRVIQHKEDSVVYVEPFSALNGSSTDVHVNFLSK